MKNFVGCSLMMKVYWQGRSNSGPSWGLPSFSFRHSALLCLTNAVKKKNTCSILVFSIQIIGKFWSIPHLRISSSINPLFLKSAIAAANNIIDWRFFPCIWQKLFFSKYTQKLSNFEIIERSKSRFKVFTMYKHRVYKNNNNFMIFKYIYYILKSVLLAV